MLTFVVCTSRSATPCARMSLRTSSMVALFWLMAWAAIGACVTTPALTSAVSGVPEAVPVPITVMDGGASSARAAAGTARSRATRPNARIARMGVSIPAGSRSGVDGSPREERLILLPRVDVAGRGPVHGDGTRPVGMGVAQLPRRLVATQGGQRLEEGAREDQRMPEPIAIRDEHDGRGGVSPRLHREIDHRAVHSGLVAEQHRYRFRPLVHRAETCPVGRSAALGERLVLHHRRRAERELAPHLGGRASQKSV